MRTLIIDQNARNEIRRVIEHAENHPVKLNDVKAMAEKKLAPIGDQSEFSCIIPMGFRVVFSFEEQPPGLCRHLSVSILGSNKLPHPEAVNMIMREFGFTTDVRNCLRVWLENEVSAINILELIDVEREAWIT